MSFLAASSMTEFRSPRGPDEIAETINSLNPFGFYSCQGGFEDCQISLYFCYDRYFFEIPALILPGRNRVGLLELATFHQQERLRELGRTGRPVTALDVLQKGENLVNGATLQQPLDY